MKDTQQSATSRSATKKQSKRFTAEERAAMKERAKELKAAKSKAEGERDVLAKIAEMAEPDRAMAERLHALIAASAPALAPKTYYGMPAYAKDGKVVCFFRDRQKFTERYATFGFNDTANLDDGAMWPVAYALTELTAADEARIGDLVKQAVS
jgi:uncharacterized protein YdhG (YjbR/CyaY superfamily)